MAAELPQMVWQLDEPQADLAALNVLYISRLARRHGIKVLLSGAGGDDLFTGYRRHRALGLDELWRRVPSGVRGAIATSRTSLAGAPTASRDELSRLLDAAAMDGDERLASYFDWVTPVKVHGLFVPGLLRSPAEQPLRSALREMPATATTLQRMLLARTALLSRRSQFELHGQDEHGCRSGNTRSVPRRRPRRTRSSNT